MNTAKVKVQIQEYIEQLSLKRLRVAVDFLAYLAERESEEATQELLNVPGFMDMLQEAEQEAEAGELTDWRLLNHLSS